MKKQKYLIGFAFSCIILLACNGDKGSKEFKKIINKDILQECNESLRLAMMRDKFSPPVAARNYAYSNIAAYQALLPFFKNHKSLAGQLNDMPETEKCDTTLVNADLAAMAAFIKVAIKVTYSEFMLDSFYIRKKDFYKQVLPKNSFEASIAFGEKVGSDILEWASRDTFRESRNFDQYQPLKTEDCWECTPPDFARAIEPNWHRIRPFVIPTADAFKTDRPTKFDISANSQFMKEAKFVYQAVSDSTPEKIAIARFWDDNPNVSHHIGHMMYSTEKPSPAGHWMGITRTALRLTNATLESQAEAFTMISIGMHDAFIACWDEKYRSNYIRPETVIRRHINENWNPILQTPPFPEYPSGHSVVSGCLTTLLTYHFGDNFAYTDSTELPFGNAPRSFTSFKSAASEACISRLYGGIHFMPAITNGRKMGDSIGNFIYQKVKLK